MSLEARCERTVRTVPADSRPGQFKYRTDEKDEPTTPGRSPDCLEADR